MVVRWWESLNARPSSRDTVIATAWLLLGLALLHFGAYPLWSDVAVFTSSGFVFLLTLAAMFGIALLRSRRPFTALCLGIVVAGVDLLFGGSLGVVIILSDLIYAAMKYGSDRGVRYTLWAAAGSVLILTVGLIVIGSENATVPIISVQWGLIVTISGVWGWNVRSERVRTRAALVEQHGHATRELRSRIAHDLHDHVANQIAVAGLHIEAAKLLAAPAARDTAAMVGSLEQAKRGTDQAHRQLRDLIAVLTAVDDLDEPAAIELAGELDELAQLLPAGRALVWNGNSAGDLRAALDSLTQSNQRVVLRVLQELVANAVKHGTGDVDVCVDDDNSDGGQQHPTHTVVSLANTSAAPTSPAPGTGLGINGAKLLLGGIGATLATAQSDGGGSWRATLTVPLVVSNRTVTELR